MDQPVQPSPPGPERTPLVRLVQGQEVNLGCGTLIVIALIVYLCSGAGKTDLSPVLNKLDEQDRKIQRLEQQLEELNKKLPPQV